MCTVQVGRYVSKRPLMEGAQTLTVKMNVYVFAICCWEILNMGALPWPHWDDNAVRHYVLSGLSSPLSLRFPGNDGNLSLLLPGFV